MNKLTALCTKTKKLVTFDSGQVFKLEKGERYMLRGKSKQCKGPIQRFISKKDAIKLNGNSTKFKTWVASSAAKKKRKDRMNRKKEKREKKKELESEIKKLTRKLKKLPDAKSKEHRDITRKIKKRSKQLSDIEKTLKRKKKN